MGSERVIVRLALMALMKRAVSPTASGKVPEPVPILSQLLGSLPPELEARRREWAGHLR